MNQSDEHVNSSFVEANKKISSFIDNFTIRKYFFNFKYAIHVLYFTKIITRLDMFVHLLQIQVKHDMYLA